MIFIFIYYLICLIIIYYRAFQRFLWILIFEFIRRCLKLLNLNQILNGIWMIWKLFLLILYSFFVTKKILFVFSLFFINKTLFLRIINLTFLWGFFRIFGITVFIAKRTILLFLFFFLLLNPYVVYDLCFFVFKWTIILWFFRIAIIVAILWFFAATLHVFFVFSQN